MKFIGIHQSYHGNYVEVTEAKSGSEAAEELERNDSTLIVLPAAEAKNLALYIPKLLKSKSLNTRHIKL